MKKYFIILAAVLGVIFLVYVIQLFWPNKVEKSKDTKSNEGVENKVEDTPRTGISEAPPQLVYDETPVYEGAGYFEKFPVIEGQQAYLAYPRVINPEKPPRLIVYSHGSNTTVTANINDLFMQDLQLYGAFFTDLGYAFAASNQHGMNYGNQTSINDTKYMVDWIGGKYKIQEKVNQIGFSMGGLPAIYFTTQYPNRVNAMALLAPVTYEWGSKIYTPLENIPIKIWHGTADANVGYSASTGFIQRGSGYKLKVELRTIQNVGHFAVDTEYMNEISEFFKANE
ncbi:alpha/beta fold hydrolase [Candidatus Dojkabacteria bacterium]|nr:alpha/beta fold hydrolase [Candidatus Dojkabacteria bacterium]